MKLQYEQKIHNYLQTHKQEIVETLKELIRIPSVRGEGEKNAPFGKACANVLDLTEGLYKNNGFVTELDRESGYLLSYYGEGDRSLGLFAHADVVPVSGDWVYTEPFAPIEKEGCIIGRGALDDKSAVVISLYCAKMLKELAIPFDSRLVLFTGSNEESGMEDIKHYISAHLPPRFSLVIDTAFPLYRGNKGSLLFTAVCKKPVFSIKNMIADNAKGAILGKIKIVLAYEKEVFAFLKANESETISVTAEQNEIIIEARGISKHTALVEGSLNAGYPAFDLLSRCTYFSESDRAQFRFIAALLSEYYGNAIGIENNDPDFGKLTFANDLVGVENGTLNLHFNLRFGAAVNRAALKEKIKKEFSQKDWEVEFEREAPAKLTDINDPMLQGCLNVYKEYTGDQNAEISINAGGTYARYLPRAAEVGTTLCWDRPKGRPRGHGGAHQPDECISIDGLLGATECIALMLLKADELLKRDR